MRNAESKAVWVGMRKALLLFAMALVTLALCSGVALAATKVGTEASETLTGTNDNDRITGKGGDDLTIGKNGNDTYRYTDGWGVDGIMDSGGKDTLDFSQVSNDIGVYLCSDLRDRGSGITLGAARDLHNNVVVYGVGLIPGITKTSHIENARGGPGYSEITGCGLDNKMWAGGGTDTFIDMGGIADVGSATVLAPSDEVYSGLGEPEQTAVIVDCGGSDVVNLKPYATGQVDLLKTDADQDGTPESLVILTGQESGIIIGDANNTRSTPGLQLDGRIEKVVFKDKTVSSTQLMEGAAPASASVKAMADEGASEVLEDPAGLLEDVQLPQTLPARAGSR